MSRYSGRQGRGAARRTRALKREQAAQRQAVYDDYKQLAGGDDK